jgi:misacylated tRNA(Ala) deacylase
MTKELFRDDGYIKQCDAQVIAQDGNKVALDQTVFYPMGGGQPGDRGVLVRHDGERVDVQDTIKDRGSEQIWHVIDEGLEFEQGERISAVLDWERRYSLMRLHSCMHMLCAVVPAPVTGGSIRDDGTARLDFDLPEPPDKAELNDKLNALTTASHVMRLNWITDKELQAQPDLVRTMSVQPPMGAGTVRLVEFVDVDLQPCGGTHVANSNEIGAVTIQSIKKKGKLNRRITIALV